MSCAHGVFRSLYVERLASRILLCIYQLHLSLVCFNLLLTSAFCCCYMTACSYCWLFGSACFSQLSRFACKHFCVPSFVLLYIEGARDTHFCVVSTISPPVTSLHSSAFVSHIRYVYFPGFRCFSVISFRFTRSLCLFPRLPLFFRSAVAILLCVAA